MAAVGLLVNWVLCATTICTQSSHFVTYRHKSTHLVAHRCILADVCGMYM